MSRPLHGDEVDVVLARVGTHALQERDAVLGLFVGQDLYGRADFVLSRHAGRQNEGDSRETHLAEQAVVGQLRRWDLEVGRAVAS